ncbi:MAG: metalloregulator ArsR/SmtB family transcription factor [Alphaproteobacteria bacterium]|nr:metalloregulator ArsR/SmtB family transcription factor [Alphaproteobacteria bacterium]MBU0858782.1 metalloregulator ArsR/SmtB family transcription factor [Alphaproteobacteria bacterium]
MRYLLALGAESWVKLDFASILGDAVYMDASESLSTDDVTIFEALAQPTRLAALRQLLAAGTAGLAAGTLAKNLDVPHNTLSFHLSFLVKAGLATVVKSGRQMIYRAETGRFQGLIRSLAESGSYGVTEDPRTGAALIELPPAAHN